MRYGTIDDFDEAWEYFHNNKEWFPHVRKSHVRNRLENGQLILQDNVLITQHEYQKTGPIGRDTDVIASKGDYIIHQIIAKNKGSGEASKVLKEYFEYVSTNVFLTVRANNENANKFYAKVGMEIVGTITWSQGTMEGLVWKYQQ